MAKKRYTISPREPEPSSDVFQTAALKVATELAVDIVEMSPSELMSAYSIRQIRYEDLRKRFNPAPPFINGHTSNEELGEIIAGIIVGALDTVRG